MSDPRSLFVRGKCELFLVSSSQFKLIQVTVFNVIFNLHTLYLYKWCQFCMFSCKLTWTWPAKGIVDWLGEGKAQDDTKLSCFVCLSVSVSPFLRLTASWAKLLSSINNNDYYCLTTTWRLSLTNACCNWAWSRHINRQKPPQQ